MPRMMKTSFRSESQAGGASREECVNAGVLSFRRHPSSSDAGLGHPLASLIRVRLLSVAAFGLTAHGKHFLALFPETLGGPFRDILQHIGLSLVDRGVPARIDDRIPFIDLRAKDLCARVKRGNRNRNKATGEPVIGGAADEAVETSSFCNGSDVLGLGVEVFDGNAENMGNLMRTREARIKRNVGLKAFELDAMSQLLRRVSRPGGAACQKKRNRYGDRKDKSFCGLFVISVGCGDPAES